jgi:signal transduction histidine kinase
MSSAAKDNDSGAGRLEALTRVAVAVARSPDLSGVLATGLDAALGALGLGIGAVYLLDEASGELRLSPHHRGISIAYAEAVSRFRKGEALIGRALLGSTPLVVPDLANAVGARDATRRLGLRTVAFAPLYAQGRAVGMMPVGSHDKRELSAEEISLLEAIGGMLGAAIDNARLVRRAERHLDQVKAVAEIDRAIVEDRELGDVLGVIAREAAGLGDGDAVIFLVEDGALRVGASHGTSAPRVLGDPPVIGGAPLATLLATSTASALEITTAGGPARAFVIPMRAGERVLGGLVLVKPDPESADDDLTILSTFGSQASVALAKARGREMERRRAGQLALVSAASEIAVSTLDSDALLGSIARYIQRSFQYYAVSVYLVDSEAREARLCGAAGAASVMPRDHRMKFGAGIVGWVSERGEYVLANEVSREPRFVPSRMEATRSELCVPVRLVGEVVAVINVESDRTGAFDEGDLVALDAIAAQLASSIRNARVFAEKLRALRNLEIVQEITNVLNSDLDLDALLERIARRSVEAVRTAQRGAVLLYDGGALRVRSSHGYARPEALAATRLAFHEGLAGSVFVGGIGRAATPGDHGAAEAAFREAAGGAQAKSALCVPIALPQEKLGVLLLENATSPGAFDAVDLRFAATLADQAAIAIGNALRLSKILALDQHRREYLSNVSHELRTPLTVIHGTLEALAAGSAGPRAAELLKAACAESARLGRRIDEILEVARLEQGVAQKHLEWGPVALDAVLRKVKAALQQEALVKGIRFEERIATALPRVPGDERLLRLLAMNLVENAVKFTPEGGTITLGLEALGQDLALSVADTGIGIAPEHQGRIFEKFYTVDGGLSRMHRGAGIGLYLAREVVLIHSGALRVESRPEGGARFEVLLPLRPVR